MATGKNRDSDRGCRYARTLANRLYAQPCPHDRRFISCQKFTTPLASWRGLVSRLSCRCRSSQQFGKLAVDCRMRSRCRSLFSHFQPVTQGEKFDLRSIQKISSGTRSPAPSTVCSVEHGISITRGRHRAGKQYPKPIVDLKTSRERALAAFASLKSSA